MIPIKFPEQTITYAKDQSEYFPLPAIQINDQYGTVISCWKLTWLERIKTLIFGKIWHHQMCFRQPLQPVKMTIHNKLFNSIRD